MLDFTSTGLILIVPWYVLLYLLTISPNLPMYTFFEIEVIYFKILFFQVLINVLVATDFPSLCAEYSSTSMSHNHDFIDRYLDRNVKILVNILDFGVFLATNFSLLIAPFLLLFKNSVGNDFVTQNFVFTLWMNKHNLN